MVLICESSTAKPQQKGKYFQALLRGHICLTIVKLMGSAIPVCKITMLELQFIWEVHLYLQHTCQMSKTFPDLVELHGAPLRCSF